MTTTNPQHARAGLLAKGWRAFRRWRRARPFWGGLLTALSGLEVFGTTQMSLGGFSFQMGPTGFLSWLIPTILVACGMLIWFTPQQRMFYSIVGAMTAVFSLIAVNLGGFFIGMLLGMFGGALGFAWVPAPVAKTRPATDSPGDEPADGSAGATPEGSSAEATNATEGDDVAGSRRPMDSSVDELLTGPLTDTLPQPRNPLREPAPHERRSAPGESAPDESRSGSDAADDPPPPDADGELPRRTSHLFVVALLLTGLTATGVLVLNRGVPAQAAPCPPATQPTPSATATPAPVGPSASPTASPSASPERDGNPLTDIIGGIAHGLGDLLGGGDDDKEPGTPATEPAAPGAQPAPPVRPSTGTRPGTRPGVAPGTCAPGALGSPAPSGSVGPVPRVAPLPGQPYVNRKPSLMTGTKVTMYGLRLNGIVELPLKGGGTVSALDFGMRKAVTNDFALRVPGPVDKSQLLKSSALSVEGDVHFYTSRFSGKLATPITGQLVGVPLVLTPKTPIPPGGIPLTLPVPVVFNNPKIDLVFVQCNTLTAPDLNHALV